jgi:uncharacterized membrane protein
VVKDTKKTILMKKFIGWTILLFWLIVAVSLIYYNQGWVGIICILCTIIFLSTLLVAVYLIGN